MKMGKIPSVFLLVHVLLLLNLSSADDINDIQIWGEKDTTTTTQQAKLFEDVPEDDYYNDDAGETCNPSDVNPCPVKGQVCIWYSKRMDYKCSTGTDKAKREGKKRRLGQKGKKRKNNPNAHKDDDMEELSHDPVPVNKDDTTHEVPPPPPPRRPMGRSMNAEIIPHPIISKVHTGNHRSQSNSRKGGRSGTGDEEGTNLEVPSYQGSLTWDGTGPDVPCLLKHVLAENLQSNVPMEDKKNWVQDNKNRICNFNKFFHCYKQPPDYDPEDDEHHEPIDDDYGGASEGVCRCYESSMTIVKSTCYIPARFGTKSACGSTNTLPYPIKPPHGTTKALKPKCTPNSDCIDSQFWFGKRCECKFTATFNPKTHACDNATNQSYSSFLFFFAIIANFFSLSSIFTGN